MPATNGNTEKNNVDYSAMAFNFAELAFTKLDALGPRQSAALMFVSCYVASYFPLGMTSLGAAAAIGHYHFPIGGAKNVGAQAPSSAGGLTSMLPSWCNFLGADSAKAVSATNTAMNGILASTQPKVSSAPATSAPATSTAATKTGWW